MIIKFMGFDIEATTEEVLAMLTAAHTAIEVATNQEFMAIAEHAPEPEPKPAPKKQPKKSTTKKELDVGKIKALRKAGWSFQKIADEMGVASAQTIANHLKGAE